jgi:hypothetical protein
MCRPAGPNEKEKKMKRGILAAILGVALLSGVALYASPPVRNVRPVRHPNLAAAQHLAQRAFEKIVAAQKGNEWDMQGHAQKAKELLEEVNSELKLAAEAANQNAH